MSCRATLASLPGVDPDLEDAACVLGANRFVAFFKVTLPLIRPGVAAGGLFAFITSFDNVPVSIFLVGARTRPCRSRSSRAIEYRRRSDGRGRLDAADRRDRALPDPGRALDRLPPLRLRQKRMPMTSRGFPLMLTFDLDAETMWTARDPQERQPPDPDVAGRLRLEGRRPARPRPPRPLRHQVDLLRPGHRRSSSAAVVEASSPPATRSRITATVHAWIVNLTPEQEREEMARGIEIIERVDGRSARAAGARPRPSSAPITLSLIKEYGFDYSSNFFDDNSPYLLEIDGKTTRHRRAALPLGARRCALLPILDHAPGPDHAGAVRRARSLDRRVRRALRRGPHDDGLAMHPEIIGQPSRLEGARGADRARPGAIRTSGSPAATQSPTDMRPLLEAAEDGDASSGRACRPPHPRSPGARNGIGLADRSLVPRRRRDRRRARPRCEARSAPAGGDAAVAVAGPTSDADAGGRGRR